MSVLEPDHSADVSTSRTGLLSTAGGLLLLSIGLACLVFLGFNVARDFALWLVGRTILGEVTEQWVERLDDRQEGELTFRYLIRYRYTASNGQTFARDSTLSANEWSGLTVGSPVSVIYFPLYPAHARLEDRRYAMVYMCAYLPFGLLAWVSLRAGWHLFRSARTDSEGESVGIRWVSSKAPKER
jgi:hypothetical protein